ncbi:MAG: SPOR domain-containing protein [Marinoscillum sp.]|uniref:SPOR domain-containing protein n=1 Tax=Marinoscillum sp. TaxID=2024838 RepID=UPI0032F83DEF
MSEEANGSNKAIRVIVFTVFIVAGLVGLWYWVMYKPEQEARERAQLEQIAREEAAKKAAELTAQNKIKYDQLIKDADAEMPLQNWQRARSLYSEASSLFPNEKYPKDQLAIVNKKLDELAAIEARRAAGVVESVSTRTGRFHIIVSSSIDDDLAMDYANKLAKEGNAIKIIEHDTGKLIYYRVSVGDYPTREQAESAAASFSNLSDDIWVLGY